MEQKIISLFSGAGGFDLGFELSGYWETVLVNDVHEKMIETLEYNKGRIFNNHRFLEGADILKGDVTENLDKICCKRADIVLGGPPCQAFSAIGGQEGYGSERGNLIFAFAEIIQRVKPKFFLFENVPNMKSEKWLNLFNEFVKYLSFDGKFEVQHYLLNCADYGCATLRERIFIFGCRRDLGRRPTPPVPTHSETADLLGLEPHITVEKSLVGLSQPTNEFRFPDLHFAPNHEPEIVARLDKLAPGERDHIRRRNRLYGDKPSFTLFAGGEQGGTRAHIHPTEPREITPREMARLHGFPDEFSFKGNKSQISIQLANSVPVPIAQAWGQHIGKNYN